MVETISKDSELTTSQEETELQEGGTPTEKNKETPPKKGEQKDFKPFPGTFTAPPENSPISCLWKLSSNVTQGDFVEEFPNGFSDNMAADDPRVKFLQDDLTPENKGVWHFLLDATAEPKPKEFTPTEFPKLLSANFRSENRDNILESTVDATSTVDQAKTLHLKQVFKENLDHFRTKTDSSWLNESNQQTISNLNTARILGLTPEKIAERRTWVTILLPKN